MKSNSQKASEKRNEDHVRPMNSFYFASSVEGIVNLYRSLDQGFQWLECSRVEDVDVLLKQVEQRESELLLHESLPEEMRRFYDVYKAYFYELSGEVALDKEDYYQALDCFQSMLHFEEKAQENSMVIGNSYAKIAIALGKVNSLEHSKTLFEKALSIMNELEFSPTFQASVRYHYAEMLENSFQFKMSIDQWNHTIRCAEESHLSSAYMGYLWYRLACCQKSTASQFKEEEVLSSLSFYELIHQENIHEPRRSDPVLHAYFLEQAIQSFLIGLNLSKDSSAHSLFYVYQGMGDCYVELQQLETSISFYYKAIELINDRGVAQHDVQSLSQKLISALFSLGRYQEAEEFYSEVVLFERESRTDSIGQDEYTFSHLSTWSPFLDEESVVFSEDDSIEIGQSYASIQGMPAFDLGAMNDEELPEIQNREKKEGL